MESQRDLEVDAYIAVARAFAAGPPDWEKEEVLTKLRIILAIDNEFHMNLMASIREGRALPRPARNASARPSNSLGGAAAAGRRPPAAAAEFGKPAPGATPGRRAAAAAAAVHSYSGDSQPEASDGDYSDELSLGRQRSKRARSARDGGAGGGKRSGGGVRRAPSSRPTGGGGGLGRTVSGATMPRSASARPRSSRPRDGRFVAGEDPLGYVGRRVWRYWASENPPWVEGYISLYNPDTNDWTIVYDPNTDNETMEENFSFEKAREDIDFVIAEYVDVSTMSGSRRQAEKPVILPALLAAPPPYTLAGAGIAPPSKKRKASMAPVPGDAPFEVGYFASRVPVAGEAELQQMLAVLERKERSLEAEIRDLDNMEADSSLLEERAALERKFAELCDREDDILQELARLRAMEA